MSQFNDMNDNANNKLLSHAHEKHEDAMKKAQMQYEQEVESLEETNRQLMKSLTSQDNLIDWLKSVNMDSAQAVSSLMQLVDEKDKVRARWLLSFIFLVDQSIAQFSSKL